MRAFEMEIHAQHKEIDMARVRTQKRLQALLEEQDELWGECDQQRWLDRVLGLARKDHQEVLTPETS